jgi:DNA-3-methyladenine glycosylase II
MTEITSTSQQFAIVTLTPPPPYDFGRTLAHLPGSPLTVLGDTEDGFFHRTITLCGNPVLLQLHSTGTPSEPRLSLQIDGSQLSPETVQAAVHYIESLFCLTEDLAPMLGLALRDPVISNLLSRFTGLRPFIIADPFETLLWAIIGQQINTTFARKLSRTLVTLCNRRLIVGDSSYPLLPTPEDVAVLDEDLLRANQFSRQKAATILRISRAIISGELDLDALQFLPDEEAIAALTKFNGIGRWTAEVVLLRGVGRFTIIPAGDVALRAVIGRAYGLERAATEVEVREIAEPWGSMRGLLTVYWWLASHPGLTP